MRGYIISFSIAVLIASCGEANKIAATKRMLKQGIDSMSTDQTLERDINLRELSVLDGPLPVGPVPGGALIWNDIRQERYVIYVYWIEQQPSVKSVEISADGVTERILLSPADDSRNEKIKEKYYAFSASIEIGKSDKLFSPINKKLPEIALVGDKTTPVPKVSLMRQTSTEGGK